jgi:hypothetical protein
MRTYNENLQVIEGLIESKTPLLPEIAIDGVVRDNGFAPNDKGTGQLLRDYLTHRTAVAAENTPNFIQMLAGKGNTGRDYFYSMLGHWAEGLTRYEASEEAQRRAYLSRYGFTY